MCNSPVKLPTELKSQMRAHISEQTLKIVIKFKNHSPVKDGESINLHLQFLCCLSRKGSVKPVRHVHGRMTVIRQTKDECMCGEIVN